jgi:hypothetical protein
MIDGDVRAPRDVEQLFPIGFMGLIEFFELEVVEPDAAAASLTDVNGDIPNCHLLQLI